MIHETECDRHKCAACWGHSDDKLCIQKQIIYQSWVEGEKTPCVCDDRLSPQMPIEEEQWTAVFALRTEAAVTALSETPATVPLLTALLDGKKTPEKYITKILFYSPSTT